VRIIATSAVADRINIVYQEKIDKWKKILGQVQPLTLLLSKDSTVTLLNLRAQK